MAPRLTIVVACTDRKTLVPSRELRAHSLGRGRVAKRLERWVDRVQTSPTRTDLGSLYKGEAWQSSLRLATVAKVKGFNVETLVVSAGLGLRRLSDQGPGYSATFTPGQADSVGVTLEDSVAWWTGLNERLSTQRLPEIHGVALLVLSDVYARVVDKDLTALGTRNSEVVVFGGWRDAPGLNRIPADATLRTALGGTLSSLNQKMAGQWLQLVGTPATLGSTRHWRRWRNWIESSRVPEVYSRRPLTDKQVEAWVQRTRNRDPELSKTRALRVLRDEGFACEQKRFAAIFNRLED